MQNERVQWLHPVRVFVWICGVQCSERKLPCQCTYRRPHHPSTTSHRILILVLILVLRMMPFFLLTVITVDKSAQHPVGLGPLVVFLRGIRQHVFGHGHGRSCRHGGTTTPPSERAIALHVRKVGQGNRLDADRWRHGMYVLSKTFLSHPDAFPLCGDGVIVEDPAVGVVGHPVVVVPGPTRRHHSRGYCRSGERPESAQSHGTKTTTVAAVVVATAVCQLVCVCLCIQVYRNVSVERFTTLPKDKQYGVWIRAIVAYNRVPCGRIGTSSSSCLLACLPTCVWNNKRWLRLGQHSTTLHTTLPEQ